MPQWWCTCMPLNTPIGRRGSPWHPEVGRGPFGHSGREGGAWREAGKETIQVSSGCLAKSERETGRGRQREQSGSNLWGRYSLCSYASMGIASLAFEPTWKKGTRAHPLVRCNLHFSAWTGEVLIEVVRSRCGYVPRASESPGKGGQMDRCRQGNGRPHNKKL